MRNIRIFFKNIYKYWVRLFFKALYGHISCNLQNVLDSGVIIKKVESRHLVDSQKKIIIFIMLLVAGFIQIMLRMLRL